LETGIILAHEGGRALGESAYMAAHSATEVAKKVTSTHTLCISDDVAANDVAVGQVVSTLEAFRGSDTPIIPSFLTLPTLQLAIRARHGILLLMTMTAR